MMPDSFSSKDRNMMVETHTLLKTHVNAIIKTTEDHEDRIRTVESRQGKIMAFFGFAAAGIGSAATSLWGKIF